MSCRRPIGREQSATSLHRSRSASRRGRAHGRALKFEPLEPRHLLAVFTVANLDDLPVAAPNDAPGTLRQAIFDANATPGSDEIAFDGVSGTLALSQGELKITDALSVFGPGADSLVIDAHEASRIFSISDSQNTPTISVSISGLGLTGGYTSSSGGAIYNRENLEVIDCILESNTADDSGGAIYSLDSNVSIIGSYLYENASYKDGGAVYTNGGNLSVVSSEIYLRVSGNSSLENTT